MPSSMTGGEPWQCPRTPRPPPQSHQPPGQLIQPPPLSCLQQPQHAASECVINSTRLQLCSEKFRKEEGGGARQSTR